MISGLVSIAIPAYKRAFLRESINSALMQDYSNLEILVVDDNSPQDIAGIVDTFDDKRIRYYRNKRNLGKKSIAYNWNKCVRLAKGEFFVLLCDDDVLMPSFVSELLRLAGKYPQCNVFHARRCVRFEEKNEEIAESPWPENESEESFINNKFQGKRKHTVTEFLYRTAFLKRHKYMAYPLGWYSDDATILNLVAKGGTITSSDKILVKYRSHKETISNNREKDVLFIKAKALARYCKFLIRTYDKEAKSLGIAEFLDNRKQLFYKSFGLSPFCTKIKLLAIMPWKFSMGLIFNKIKSLATSFFF